jgi:S-adenosylmethionine hydrolase
MSIITLTTDFGLKDYYVAALKGTILSKNRKAQIVDISHEINSFDIVQAAFVLKNAYDNFPKGSIHILCVNNYHETLSPYLIIEKDGHYFVGPDNGIFTLVFEDLQTPVYKIEAENLVGVKFKSCIADLIFKIDAGMKPEQIGLSTNSFLQRIHMNPVTSETHIRGVIIHVDNYENVMVNIKKDLFDKLRKGRNFSIFFKRFDPIKRISEHYHDVPIGDTLCLFNSSGYLEIAINMGKASSLLGLKIDESIQIDFEI